MLENKRERELSHVRPDSHESLAMNEREREIDRETRELTYQNDSRTGHKRCIYKSD